MRLFETRVRKSERSAEYVATQLASLLAWLLGGLHSETSMTRPIKGYEVAARLCSRRHAAEKEGQEMIPQKDPPGYPGDETIRKGFGQCLKKARLECGLTIEQAEVLLREALTPNANHNRTVRFGRTLGIVVRKIRESKGMTRIQLAGNSGLPLRFIILVERGKVTSGGDVCQLVRLAYGLKYPVGKFFDELTDLNEDLTVGAL